MPSKRISHEDHRIYEMWHRPASLTRFLGSRIAEIVWSIDLDHPNIDCVFACHRCGVTIALAEDTEGPLLGKATRITVNLAKDANKPAYLIRFSKSDHPNPYAPDYPDIDSFEIKTLHPSSNGDMLVQSPAAHADWLVIMHGRHWRDCKDVLPTERDQLRRAWLERPFVHGQQPPAVPMMFR